VLVKSIGEEEVAEVKGLARFPKNLWKLLGKKNWCSVYGVEDDTETHALQLAHGFLVSTNPLKIPQEYPFAHPMMTVPGIGVHSSKIL
jgi:hypothetical protein